MGSAARALGFLRALTEAGAGERSDVAAGTLLQSPDERFAYVANQLLLDRPAGLGAREVVALLDELQDGLHHRRAYVQDDAEGERLHRALLPFGWGGGAEIVLHLPADVVPPAATATATADRDRLRALERRTNVELGLADVVADQLAVVRSRAAERVAAQGFVATTPEGVDVAHATLYGNGAVVQIDDVATLVEHRGHGYGKDVVAACVAHARAAGADVVFLTADADDWPQHLYRGMGFVPLARTWVLQRESVALGV